MDDLIKEASKVPRVPKNATEVERVSITRRREVVDETLLKPIKQMCKSFPEQIDEAKRYLFLDLQHKNWIVRVRCLQVIDALFLRSSKFRSLACSDIREITQSGMLLNAKRTMMMTPEERRLQARVLQTLELWDVQFGHGYPVLRATARYLRESLKVKMPNVAQRAKEFAHQRRQSEEARGRVTTAKRNQVFTETANDLRELELDVQRMEAYFEVLVPDLGNMISNRALGQEEEEEAAAKPVKRARLGEDVTVGDAAGAGTGAGASESNNNEDDVDWEEEGGDDAEGAAEEVGDSVAAAQAPPLSSMAVNPLPIEIDIHASRSNTQRPLMDADVARAMEKHSVYLARHGLPRLQRWQDALVAAASSSSSSSSSPSLSSESRTMASAQATSSLLRRIALLNIQLRRLLLDKCVVVFQGAQLKQLVGEKTR
jgi:hypothetical protein